MRRFGLGKNKANSKPVLSAVEWAKFIRIDGFCAV